MRNYGIHAPYEARMFISIGSYTRHSLSGQLQTLVTLPLALFEYWAARAQEPILGFRDMNISLFYLRVEYLVT
jgi:hypothetical protein